MDISRLERGHRFAGAGGALLVLSLFFKWYETNGVGATAWQALTYTDLLIFVAGAVGVAYALMRAFGIDGIPPAVVTALAAIATVFVLYRLASPPGQASTSILGPFIAIVGGVAQMYGGWLGMRSEGRGFANDPDKSPGAGPPKSQTEI